jgi:hypothetical protein
MRLALVLLAGCGGAAATPAAVDNTTGGEPPACAALSPPRAEPVAPGVECVRGEATPILAAPAEPPACHAFAAAPADPRVALERATVDGVGEVTIEHAGCAHWGVTIRAAVTPAEAGRLGELRAAALLLRALPAPPDDQHLNWVADAIEAAVARRDPAEPVVITDGYEHAYVSIEDGALVVQLDIAL